MHNSSKPSARARSTARQAGDSEPPATTPRLAVEAARPCRAWAANDAAVRHGQRRVLSAYRLPAGLASALNERQMWVITDDLEDPDTATTVLWPSDY